MAELKTYVCPKCGAKTANTENCEFCGSMLVRFVEEGIDIRNTPYLDNSIVFPGLINELNNNLRLQAENKRGVTTDIGIALTEDEIEVAITVENPCESPEIEPQNTPTQIGIVLNFYQIINPESPKYDNNEFLKTENEITKFTQLLSFPLFTRDIQESTNEVLDQDYRLNCGQDVESAARIISEILIKVKGLSPSDAIDIDTWYPEEIEDAEESQEIIITSFKDLVIQTLTNDSEIKAKAEKGDAMSCFQMGMKHLLGIETSIDFKKASKYFGHQSLNDDLDANGLLGFIAECEGNYSLAFQHYAKLESNEIYTYLDKVIKGREHIQNFLKEKGLPATLNKVISSFLGDYSKGKASRVGASVKVATLCNDELTCLEAADNLFNAKEYLSAIQWLQKGQVASDNSIYSAINKVFEESRKSLLSSDEITVIDLDGCSLLNSENITPFLNNVKKSCEEASVRAGDEWKEKVKKLTNATVKEQKEKERLEQLELEAEEAARKRKRNLIIKHSIACLILFICGTTNKEAENWFVGGISTIVGAYFLFFLFRGIWKIFKK